MKGKKTDTETIYKVMLSYAVTGNYSETARDLDMPISTVKKIVDDNREEPEFIKLCKQKQEEFVDKADDIIYKAITLLEKRLDTALYRQDELDELIDEIYRLDKSEFDDNKKKAVANKLHKMQLNSLSEITTALGTMYDKRALAKGEPTSNERLSIKVELTD